MSDLEEVPESIYVALPITSLPGTRSVRRVCSRCGQTVWVCLEGLMVIDTVPIWCIECVIAFGRENQ